MKTLFWKVLVRQSVPDIKILLWEKQKAQLLKIAAYLLQTKEILTWGKSFHAQSSGTHSSFLFALVQDKTARPC